MKCDGLVEGTQLERKIDAGAVNTFITEEVYYTTSATASTQAI